MKYGLIYYKKTENLGDDILSYAAKQFLPRVDYYIDREAMDVFVPEEEEVVASIMNGWYLHNNYAFPPSPYIIPLFVGIHFVEYVFGGYSYLENSYVTDYLKKNRPIGCRDVNTYEVLKKNHVDSYFSGCLTLTLPPFSEGVDESKNNIVLTDVPEDIENYVKNILAHKNIIKKTHVIAKEDVGVQWELREKRVEEYLKVYQNAELVITTRLHCALPALALGTKVVLISKYDEDWRKRISDYEKYVPMFSAEDILNGKADNLLISPELIHSESIGDIREKLIQNCEAFIKKSENMKEWIDLPQREQYKELYVDRAYSMRKYISDMTQYLMLLNSSRNQLLQTLKDSESVIQKLVAQLNNKDK